MADDASSSPQTNQPNLPGFGETSSGPWALEETLKKVLSTLQKDVGNNARQNRNFDILNRNIDRLTNVMSDSADDALDASRRENSAAAQTRRQLEDIRKSTERGAKASEEAKRANNPDKNKARDNLMGGGGGGGGALGMAKDIAMKGAKSVLQAGQAIMDSQGDLASATAGVAAAIPVFGGLLASASKMVNNARDQLAELATTGQTVNYSMIDFANAATSAGLSTGQAAKIISANSTASAKLGTTGFLDLQMSVRRVTEKMGRFGYSLDDQAKITASFYENQMTRGNRAQAKNANAIADYTAKLSTLSKLTGKSIDTLLEEEKQIAESPDVFAAANRIFQRDGQQAADNFYKVVNDVTHEMPDSLKGMSEQMLSDYGKYGSIATSELGSVLANSGAGDIVKEIDAAISSGDAKAYADAMKKLSARGAQVGSDLAIHLSDLASSTGPAAESAKRVITGMRAFQASNDKVTDLKGQTQETKDQAAGSDTATFDQNQTQTQIALSNAYAKTLVNAEALTPALNQLTIAAADMTAAFMGSQMVQDATTGFANSLIDATQHMEQWMQSMTAFEGLESVLGSVIGTVLDFGGKLGELIGIGDGLGRILTGLGAWFGGKALLGKAADGAKSLFGFGGKAAAGGAAGAAEAAGGSTLASLGRGALRGVAGGGLIGSLFEGVQYFGENGKDFSWRNLARSGIRVLGGATGGALGAAGGTLVAPGVGTAVGGVAGGAAGYAGADRFATWLLGEDTYRGTGTKPGQKPPARPTPKANPIPTVQGTLHPKSATEVAAEGLAARRAAQAAALKKQQDDYRARARAAAQARNATPQPVKPTVPASPVHPQAARPARGGQPAQHPTQAAAKPQTGTDKVAFPTGDEMQNRQLQEMQTTNKILMGIFGNGKQKLRPTPAVTMYNGGYW